jgi:hypothetical protein
MYRRRRSQREKIFFSFDSFLDVVANVIGIIIRLILVAWVGAKTYTASMEFNDEEPPAQAPKVASAPLPPPKPSDDPLYNKLDLTKAELADARDQLLGKLRNLEAAKEKTLLTQKEMEKLAQKNQEIAEQQRALEKELESRGQHIQMASLSLEGLRKRGQDIAAQIASLQKVTKPTKELKFHAPVSRVVQGDEMFFECRGGRVAFIDMPSFMQEIRDNSDEIGKQLRTEARVQRVTSQIGAFRLQYGFEREGGLVDAHFRYSMVGWLVEPVSAQRGETAVVALAKGSDFRRLADATDPNQTVVTFWVYPDSFEIFRALRDYLYERDVEVAGRPLPMNAPIAASRYGTKSRGQ